MDDLDTSLSKEDCETMLSHLDASLAVLERNKARPSSAEIQIKSMLAVLRREISKAVETVERPQQLSG